MKTIFFIILIIAQVSWGQVQFNPTQMILLEGQTCGELQLLAQDIASWSESISKQSTTQPECFCSAKTCHMDVAPLSPYFVKDLTNYAGGYSMESAYSGPNCFNAALVSSGTLAHITFTHPLEISALLQSPLCSERQAKELILPGDILVIRDQSNPLFEIHAGVFISDLLSFSKYGESNLMPYSYGINVQKVYGVTDDKCRYVVGTPNLGDPCYQKPYANYFKCTNMSSFISQILHEPGGFNESVRKIYATISSLDLQISNRAFKGENLNQIQLKQIQIDLKLIYLQSEILEPMSENNRALLKVMKFHIYSLFEQTRRFAKALDAEDMVTEELIPPIL